MFSFEQSLAFAAIALASQASAAAVPKVSPPTSFNHSSAVHQTLNPNFNPHSFANSGPVIYAAALAKYGVAVPQSAAVASSKAVTKANQQGTVAAVPQAFDSEYLCSVQIGTPAQTLNLDFDTGSSDLWVFSSSLPSNEVNGQTVYNPSKSSSAKSLSGSTWSIGYADGSSASGNVYTDTVSVGALTVNGQAVEAATSVSSSFVSNTNSDGLMGLAFSTLNTVTPKRQTPFYQTAKSNLTNYLFTANLKKGKAGQYNFGYIDKTQYTGAITYTPVNTYPGYWTFTSSGFQIGSNSFVSQSIQAIADTGTSLLLMPQSIVTKWYAAIKGAAYSSTYGAYVYPCASTVPQLHLRCRQLPRCCPIKLHDIRPDQQHSLLWWYASHQWQLRYLR